MPGVGILITLLEELPRAELYSWQLLALLDDGKQDFVTFVALEVARLHHDILTLQICYVTELPPQHARLECFAFYSE